VERPIRGKRGALPLELVRRPEVVGIEKGERLSPRFPQSPIDRRTWSSILLPEQAQPWAVARKRLGAPVRRAVVDDQDLIRRTALGEDAVDGRDNVSRGVEQRHDDGDSHFRRIAEMACSAASVSECVLATDCEMLLPCSRYRRLMVSICLIDTPIL